MVLTPCDPNRVCPCLQVWLINLVLTAACLWLSFAPARCYPSGASLLLLSRWGVALGISWLVLEPLITLVVWLVPCISSSDQATAPRGASKVAPLKKKSQASLINVRVSSPSATTRGWAE